MRGVEEYIREEFVGSKIREAMGERQVPRWRSLFQTSCSVRTSFLLL